MTEPLDLDAIEAWLARGGFSFHNAHLKIEALIAAVRERDAEIARLRVGQARSWCEGWNSGRADVSAPPGAPLSEIPGQVLNDCGPVEYDKGAPPGADRPPQDAEIARYAADLADTVSCLKHERKLTGELLAEKDSEIARLREQLAGRIIDHRWLKQYGDERAAAATEAERRRCATIDHIDIDLIRREARAAAIEEAAQKHDQWSAESVARAEAANAEGRDRDASLEVAAVRVHEESAHELRALAERLPRHDPARWFLNCVLYSWDTLARTVDTDPKRRGGVPVIKGTRFTISQALAELAESSGIAEVADRCALDPAMLRELLYGLAAAVERPVKG